MAISADTSDPIDDSKGGTFGWGYFQQDKKSTVLVYVDVPAGTRGKQVKVTINTNSLKVAACGEEKMGGELCGAVDIRPLPLAQTAAVGRSLAIRTHRVRHGRQPTRGQSW